MKKIFLLWIGLLGVVVSFAQDSTSFSLQEGKSIQSTKANPWTNLTFNNDKNQFQFAIVTDRTGGHRPGVFMDAVNKLNILQPEFVMSVGDLIEGYTTDLNELNRQWDEFDGFVEQLDMPFFYLPGNHDITNQVMEDLWKERLGATYYSFVYQDVLMLCLNSEDQKRGSSKGTISEEQYQWIEKTLEKHQDVRWTLVFMHQPLWVQEADNGMWEDVEKLLSERKHTVYVGHRHGYVQYERNDSKYYILATTGGGSSLRGAKFGEFDHVVWITMTDLGPIMANLQLEGIWNADVVTEDTKEYINKFRRKNIIEVEPNFVTKDVFETSTLDLKITNDEDVPMEISFKPAFNWDMMVAIDSPSFTVAPNSVVFKQLQFKARKELKTVDARPVQLNATVRYAFDDENKLGIPITMNLKPLQQQYFSRTAQPIQIDGDVSDWERLPFTKSWNDATDAELHYNISYDDEFVYIGAKVIDDEVLVNEETAFFKQDGIGIIINGQPLRKSISSKGRSWYGSEIGMWLPPTASGELKQFGHSRGTPKDIVRVCKLMDGGYVFEAKIPVSYFKEAQGDNWQSIRINLLVHDFDKDYQEEQANWLYPDWRGKENIIGSGVFMKE